ncbi:MAG: hypothetical protein KAH48_05685 [Chlorobi bacterium]|nr:hypothetical protein [Chlorobiota bacterium]
MNESTGQDSKFLWMSLIVVSTASMLPTSYSNEVNIIPMKTHDYEYQQSPDLVDYSLSHERSQVPFSIESEDPVIDMLPTRTISVKFNRIKITPLEFTSVEDNEGFIE